MQGKRGTTTFTATVALLGGLAAGIACGSGTAAVKTRPLPHAGDADDDGTGVLARWSRGEIGPAPGGNSGGYDPYGGGYYGDYYGDYYGGDYYGGYYDPYGGGTYGGLGQYPYPTYEPPPQPYGPGYTVMAVNNGGAIEGTITLKQPGAPATLAPVPGAAGCTTPLANPTAGAGGSVVYLADIRVGKAPLLLGGVVEQHQCGFAPHVQLATPIGAVLYVVNRDADAHTVRVRPLQGTGDVSQNLNVPGNAQRELVMKQDGFYELTSAAEHPGAVGWVVVPPHPYYAIADENGRFRIDEIPAGEYAIVVWHEPIATGSDSTGALQRGGALEVRGKVKVVAGATTTYSVELK